MSPLYQQVRGRPPVPHPEAPSDHQQVLPADGDGGPGLLPALEAAKPVSRGGGEPKPPSGWAGLGFPEP